MPAAIPVWVVEWTPEGFWRDSDVTFIVAGSGRTAADNIRVTVMLVEAASNTLLFSQS